MRATSLLALALACAAIVAATLPPAAAIGRCVEAGDAFVCQISGGPHDAAPHTIVVGYATRGAIVPYVIVVTLGVDAKDGDAGVALVAFASAANRGALVGAGVECQDPEDFGAPTRCYAADPLGLLVP